MSITFKYLINSRNIDGEIYRCDIDRFFGIHLDSKERDDIHKQLMEIRNEKESIHQPC